MMVCQLGLINLAIQHIVVNKLVLLRLRQVNSHAGTGEAARKPEVDIDGGMDGTDCARG
jgi:hypothetical protein